MDVIVGGDESSNSKISDEPTTTTICDEASNDDSGKFLPEIPQVESATSEATNQAATSSIANTAEIKLTKSSSTRVITADTTHMRIEPSHIIEYEWPPKSGERYFIQEQIAELLDVKSFKRKYPELSRHTIEILNEREYLLKNYNLASAINEHQMHGLTALRAIEVHELLLADYPAIYSEYQKAAADKVKSKMAENQRRLDVIKMDTKRLQELRKNAMKSAFEYNTELHAIKRTERCHFWDIQTSIIQSAQNKWKRLPAHLTRPGPYPASLISGQYQQYYKRLAPDEIRRLPLSTILDYEYLISPKRPMSPSPILVQEDEIVEQSAENDDVNDEPQELVNQRDQSLEQHSPLPVLLPEEFSTEQGKQNQV